MLFSDSEAKLVLTREMQAAQAARIAALEAGSGAAEKAKKDVKDKKAPPYMIGSVYKGGLDQWSETIMMMKVPDLLGTYRPNTWRFEGDSPSGKHYWLGQSVSGRAWGTSGSRAEPGVP